MLVKSILSALLLVLSFSAALAGEDPPTVLSNKAAIEMVQSHADYLWTLIAAALVFFMQAGFAHGGEPVSPGPRMPSTS